MGLIHITQKTGSGIYDFSVSKQLQKVDVDVCAVLELNDSFIRLVIHLQREMLNEYEGNALSKVENKKFQAEDSRKTVYSDEFRDRKVICIINRR